MGVRWMVVLALVSLVGCASYRPKPLPTAPDLAPRVPDLTIDTAKLPFPELKRHRFDLSDGLDMTEVATLAVINNPQLKVARDRAGLAHAQAFAAGLLPDPQLGASADFPQNPDPALMTAFNLGLSYDLNKLITRGAGLQAAGAQARKADLNLLWQEWQVITRARLLFVRVIEQERLLRLLAQERALFQERYQRTQKALDSGNLTVDQVSAYLAALQGVDKQINDLQRLSNDTRYDLNALLGLAPQVKLKLTGGLDLPELDYAEVKALLPELPQRRPDLLALKAGYEAQEERLRQAVLAQFPAFNLGITRARDTSGIYTEGLAITLTLPLFNRNQGAIAIQKATRRELYDDYQARLNAAYSDAYRILENQKLLAAQREELDRSLQQMSRVAAAADKAFKEGIMDALHYVNLKTALINKRIEAINLDQLMLEQRVALQTLIGGELPVKKQGVSPK